MTDNEYKAVIQPSARLRLAGRIAHAFIDSKLTLLVIVAAALRIRWRQTTPP